MKLSTFLKWKKKEFILYLTFERQQACGISKWRLILRIFRIILPKLWNSDISCVGCICVSITNDYHICQPSFQMTPIRAVPACSCQGRSHSYEREHHRQTTSPSYNNLFILFSCICVCACVSFWIWCAYISHLVVSQQCGCWDQNSRHLEEQDVLLTAEPSI